METMPVNPQLVEKLAIMLEQAKSGSLVSFVAVTFKQNGNADHWAFLTRHEDMDRVPAELEALKDWPSH